MSVLAMGALAAAQLPTVLFRESRERCRCELEFPVQALGVSTGIP